MENAEPMSPQQPVSTPPVPPRSNPLNLKLIVLGVVLVGLGLLGGYLLWGNKSQPAPSQQQVVATQPTPTPDPTAGWKTFSGQDFVIKYPQEWEATTNFELGGGSDNGVQILNPNSKKPFTGGNGYSGTPSQKLYPTEYITLKSRPTSETVKQYVDKYDGPCGADQKREAGIDYIHRSAYSAGQINGEIFTVPCEGGGYKEIVISAGKKLFTFDLSNDISEKLVNQILSTFKFTDQTQAVDTTNWKTYSNTVAKVSIQYPPEWVKKDIRTMGDTGDIYGVELSGKEGNVTIKWGSGFGGGCDMQYHTNVKINGEMMGSCHNVSSDGSELWSQMGKNISNDLSTNITATANAPANINRNTILAILSTLTFSK